MLSISLSLRLHGSLDWGWRCSLVHTVISRVHLSQELAIQGQAQTQHEATHTYIHLYLQLIHMRAYAAARVSEIGRLG